MRSNESVPTSQIDVDVIAVQLRKNTNGWKRNAQICDELKAIIHVTRLYLFLLLFLLNNFLFISIRYMFIYSDIEIISMQ